MASVFKKEETTLQQPVIEIVRDSLDVNSDGSVRFRSRTGRGSGKAVEIPGDEFDEFVSLMIKTCESRQTLASKQLKAENAQPVVAENIDNSVE